MQLTIEVSKISINSEKKFLRFALRLYLNNKLFQIIQGIRIKNNKLFFPSYLTGGKHQPLIYFYPDYLENLRQMIEDRLGYAYSEYVNNLTVAHCAPTEADERTIMGAKTISQTFELGE